MGSLFQTGRVLSSAALLALFAVGSVFAADVAAPPAVAPVTAPDAAKPADVVPDPAAWQDVITGQIEAFRKADGATALSYAGAAFKKTFTDPNTFLVSIAAAGYTPIFTSVSHTFGKFDQPDPMSVVQVVDLIGPNQELYEAIYALAKEDGNWRVQGVQLAKEDGMGV